MIGKFEIFMTALVFALVGAGGMYAITDPQPDPMCSIVSTIEPEAKCTADRPNEGKVRFSDGSEAYCALKAKRGLVCSPLDPKPQAPVPAPQAPAVDAGVDASTGTGAGSRSKVK